MPGKVRSIAFRLFGPFLILSRLVGWASPAWAQAKAAWPKLEEVIVVSKTHFDIGYTDLASRVVDRYRTSMADQDDGRQPRPAQRPGGPTTIRPGREGVARRAGPIRPDVGFRRGHLA